jgi:hypothetical protein
MTTSRSTSVAVALAAVALASASAPHGTGIAPTPAAASSSAPVRAADIPTAPSRSQKRQTERYAYRWPVKPFDRQHPVRGFFGDPRISNQHRSRQFHFGIDISAPNGTPVYATVSGRASIHPLHPTTILVAAGSGIEFSYWHVVPAVRGGEQVTAYRTVLGHIEAPYGHVHFSESRNGIYLNPLRRGALGPYADSTRPTVLSFSRGVDGLVVEPHDETPLAVPRPWHDLPVMPAVVRWRLLDTAGKQLRDWKTVVDFRETIPSASEFDRIWAPGTTQNHVREPGRYRLVLGRDGELAALRPGSYVVEIALGDTRGNGSRSRMPLSVS